MILKLVQAGGFVGKPKVAEEDLSQHPDTLQQHVEDLFAQPEHDAAGNASPARDKEQLFLQYQGKTLPIDTIKPDSKLHDLIQKMRADLHFEK